MSQVKELSASLEDYLEVIGRIIKEKSVARAKEISKAMDVNMSSVTGALKALSERGMINYDPYNFITLTPKGKNKAKKIFKRHTILKEFLTRVLAVNEEEAEENACRMEHVADNEIFDRLTQFISFVHDCPRAGGKWLKGLGFFCDQGKTHENCRECVQACLDKVQPEKESATDARKTQKHVPRILKNRDRKTKERLMEILKESAKTLSDEERAVVDVFMSNETHQTIKSLYGKARKKNGRVTIDTVEDALDLLCEFKIARAVKFEQQTMYEHYHPESHHDHMVCVKCGAIVEFFDPRIEKLQTESARSANFRLLVHNLDIYGVCHHCVQQEPKIKNMQDALAGEIVEIVRITGDEQTRVHLTEMGLCEQARVRILGDRASGGNVIVMLDNARLMIDHDTARKVKVRLVTTEALAGNTEDGGLDVPYHRDRHYHAYEKVPQPKGGKTMEDALCLSSLSSGESGRIHRIRGASPFKKRLLEMGFVKGEVITKEKLAPLADPAEYIIKGYHISLRKEEADDVLLEK